MSTITSFVKKSDAAVFYLFNRKIRCALMNIFMKIVTQLGSLPFAVSVSIFLIAFLGKGVGKNIALQVIATLLLSQAIAQTVKRMVNRPRPYKTLEQVIAIKPPACQYSFPSGHTCAAFSLALALGDQFPSLAVGLLSVAFMVGLSRVYLGYHYPTDVLAGSFISFVSFIALLPVF